MKRVLVILLVLSMVLSIGLVFADTSSTGIFEWFHERMDSRRDYLEEALNDGSITEEQFEAWIEHFEYMEDFHEENGFAGGGMGFGCRGNQNQTGFGRGFMGGFPGTNQ